MHARTRHALFLTLGLISLPLFVACDGDDAMSEEECATYGYATFARERAETDGTCGAIPDVAAAAFDGNESSKCDGGYRADVCSYRFAWDCPGEDGQTITYEGIVSWHANERTGYGGSSLIIRDRDGNLLCQSTYDEAWAGDQPAEPGTDPNERGAGGAKP